MRRFASLATHWDGTEWSDLSWRHRALLTLLVTGVALLLSVRT